MGLYKSYLFFYSYCRFLRSKSQHGDFCASSDISGVGWAPTMGLVYFCWHTVCLRFSIMWPNQSQFLTLFFVFFWSLCVSLVSPLPYHFFSSVFEKYIEFKLFLDDPQWSVIKICSGTLVDDTLGKDVCC